MLPCLLLDSELERDQERVVAWLGLVPNLLPSLNLELGGFDLELGSEMEFELTPMLVESSRCTAATCLELEGSSELRGCLELEGSGSAGCLELEGSKSADPVALRLVAF